MYTVSGLFFATLKIIDVGFTENSVDIRRNNSGIGCGSKIWGGFIPS